MEGRDRGGADAAADADYGGHDVRLLGGLLADARSRYDQLGVRKAVTKLIWSEGLEQIVLDARCDKVAV
jgi:hypothetical protein